MGHVRVHDDAGGRVADRGAGRELTLDQGLGNIAKIAKLGIQFKDIGLDKIQFLTIPNKYDPADPNHLIWTPDAKVVWKQIMNDEPLSRRLADDVISAGNVPGSSGPSGSASPSPSGSPSGGASPAGNEPDKQALTDAGLCT